MSEPPRIPPFSRRDSDDITPYPSNSTIQQKPSKGGFLSHIKKFPPYVLLKNYISKIQTQKQSSTEKKLLIASITESIPWLNKDKKVRTYLQVLTNHQLRELQSALKYDDFHTFLNKPATLEKFGANIDRVLNVNRLKDKIFSGITDKTEQKNALLFLLTSPDFKSVIKNWQKASLEDIKSLNSLIEDLKEINNLVGNRLHPDEENQILEIFKKNPDKIRYFKDYLNEVKKLQDKRPIIFSKESEEAHNVELKKTILISKFESHPKELISLLSTISNTTFLLNNQVLHEGMPIYFTKQSEGFGRYERVVPHLRPESEMGQLYLESNYSFFLPENDEEKIENFKGYREIIISDPNIKPGIKSETVRQPLPFSGSMTVGQARSMNHLFFEGVMLDPSSFEHLYEMKELTYNTLPSELKNKIDNFNPNENERTSLSKQYFKMKSDYYAHLEKNLSSSPNSYPSKAAEEVLQETNLGDSPQVASMIRDKSISGENETIQGMKEYYSRKEALYTNLVEKEYSELTDEEKNLFNSIFNELDEKAKLFLYLEFNKSKNENEIELSKVQADFNSTSKLDKGWNINENSIMKSYRVQPNKTNALKAASLGHLYTNRKNEFSLLPETSAIDEISTVGLKTVQDIQGKLTKEDRIIINLPTDLENAKTINKNFEIKVEELPEFDPQGNSFLKITTSVLDETNHIQSTRVVYYLYPTGQSREITLQKLAENGQLAKDLLLTKSRYLYEKGM